MKKDLTRTGDFPFSVIPVLDPGNLSIYFTGLTRESIAFISRQVKRYQKIQSSFFIFFLTFDL